MSQPITIGKYRGLQQCTSERGTFTCLALDHRQNLRKALHPENPALTSDAELSQFKLDITAGLGREATTVCRTRKFRRRRPWPAGRSRGEPRLWWRSN